jgi:uncharacterized protein DUF3999
MKRSFSIFLPLVLALACATVAVLAEAATSAWPFFAEVTSNATTPGVYETVVTLEVLDKAREDLADLRLVDAGGREIPHAVRIRKEVDDAAQVEGRLFNQANVGTNASEVSVDLGDDPGEHNKVEIETEGMNFRRQVEIEGSDSASGWRTLASDVIYSFASQTSTVRSNHVSYPTSRYKYLRVRVFSDKPREDQPPVIKGVTVSKGIREKGENTSWDVSVSSAQLLRHDSAPASSWTIDLGARVPCDRLLVIVQDESFSRPFEVEVVDDPQNIRLVASGELRRRLGEKQQPLTITFEGEQYARKLRLLVTDYNNPTLTISSARASAPVRQLFFELKEPAAQPLRLFFGNVKAAAPHYDFEKELSTRLATSPARATISSLVSNPDFRPEPLPFTERLPWLIYLVLTVSSLALAAILFSLARSAIRMRPPSAEEPNTQVNA